VEFDLQSLRPQHLGKRGGVAEIAGVGAGDAARRRIAGAQRSVKPKDMNRLKAIYRPEQRSNTPLTNWAS